ncbi:MAG: hypothetical protein J6N49_00250 [Alphaproteobacteria bacterium]|nr:hypothetical protein [Alphaproteobacteria bacterium]
MINSNNENGRSMIEMLGVLAIIGVLSVGGIAGYSKAMMKFKINKTVDQVSQIVSNIRTLYGTQKKYVWDAGGVNTAGSSLQIFKKAHVIPDEMWNSDGTAIENAFGGSVGFYPNEKRGSDYGKAFWLSFDGIPEEACMELMTYDWGSGSSSGLIAIGQVGATAALVGCTGSATGDNVYACAGGSTQPVPMSVAVAATACSGDDNEIFWKFY